ncbi:5-oxoprolinase subunit B family protein [Nocardioides sp. GXZ039]|uniref:5-oxoprolinase subunit B family protein n=1 Tax=Nocardioides sp. GXZ039 TaxID=3136018 RepID=UPI0030F43660
MARNDDDADARADGVRLVPFGPGALLAEVGSADAALGLALHARAARAPAREVVPAATTVLFDGLDDARAHAVVHEIVSAWSPRSALPPGETVEIPTAYDGADLDGLADLWGTDRHGVIERHGAIEFVSAFCGFAPGFAYLSGLPEGLAVPRLATPRPRVPAGSVALADTWCGVYPTASPGGWRLIGRTDVALWDAARERPALLAPGTRVRFVPR